MNPTVYRLLKGFLARNIGLYIFFGLTQFLMTSVYWTFGYERVPLPGVMLGILGAAGALNFDSLVWRSLPLTTRDVGVFRWWATAALPGLFLTLFVGADWAAHHSGGLHIPCAALVLKGVLATWAGLGVFAALPPGTACIGRGFRAVNPKAIVLVVSSALVLGYGLPFEFAAQPFSNLFTFVGLSLLLLSGAKALRGNAWRWPDVGNDRPVSKQNNAPLPSAWNSGATVILVPLIRRTAVLAIVAIGTITLLRLVFPGVTYALFWVYFIGISMSGWLLAHKYWAAIQPLRCLPLSANRLAGLLQAIAVFPGATTFVLTLLVNRAFPAVGIDIPAALLIAFIVFSAQTLLERSQRRWSEKSPNAGPIQRYWLPIFQRVFWPAYIGAMVMQTQHTYGAPGWVPWLISAASVVFCVFNHFILVHQLRSGIHPSGDEQILSTG
jgi:hypothetical protein